MQKSTAFVNELGNNIRMTVTHDEKGITISATGPTSEVEHTWTKLEAWWIKQLLKELEIEQT